jgi:hypothetical protein
LGLGIQNKITGQEQENQVIQRTQNRVNSQGTLNQEGKRTQKQASVQEAQAHAKGVIKNHLQQGTESLSSINKTSHSPKGSSPSVQTIGTQSGGDSLEPTEGMTPQGKVNYVASSETVNNSTKVDAYASYSYNNHLSNKGILSDKQVLEIEAEGKADDSFENSPQSTLSNSTSEKEEISLISSMEHTHYTEFIRTRVRQMLELKNHQRGIEKKLERIEGELNNYFDAYQIDEIDLDIGKLRRYKGNEGYDWMILF